MLTTTIRTAKSCAGVAVSCEQGMLQQSGQITKGINVAINGLVDAIADYVDLPLYCLAATSRGFEEISTHLSERKNSHKSVRWIPYSRPDGLADVGLLFRPDPMIGQAAWNRLPDRTSHSICGVTYTLCSASAMDEIGALLVAPLEPWDALVCTSTAARASICETLGEYGEYLGERFGGNADVQAQLPIIPLGVDCDRFASWRDSVDGREAARKHFDLSVDDIVVLFAGRLSFHAKAHPLPMYLALEQAAQRTGKQVHLIQTGGFANASIADEFVQAARVYCPSVKMTLVDGRNDVDFKRCWQAADLFTSLSDNVQETFGITPIEAMAAGLPVVVSDWNGYRDTVRHGVDGFRIPTGMPAAGAGETLARRYLLGRDTFDRYIGYCSQSTFVDVGECAMAYEQLIASKDLRRKMGSAGRKRARQCYDWRVVMGSYEELWKELGERRQAAAPTLCTHPLRADPYSTNRCFSTVTLTDETVVSLSTGWTPGRLEQLRSTSMTSFGLELLASEETCERISELVAPAALSVGEIIAQISGERPDVLLRTLGWMIKFDLLCCEGMEVSAD